MDPLEEKYQLHYRSTHPCAVDKSSLAPQKQLLGHLPKEFFPWIPLSTPAIGVLGHAQVWLAAPHTMVVPLGILNSRNRGVVQYTPQNAGPSKAGQGYQTSPRRSHSHLMLPFVPSKWCNSHENNVIIEKSYLTE